MKKIIFTNLFLILVVNAFAQFTIAGKITDRSTNQPIANAEVSIKNTPVKVKSDEAGLFSLFSMDEIGSIEVEHSDYGHAEFEFDFTNVKTPHITIELDSELGAGYYDIAETFVKKAGKKIEKFTKKVIKDIKDIVRKKDINPVVPPISVVGNNQSEWRTPISEYQLYQPYEIDKNQLYISLQVKTTENITIANCQTLINGKYSPTFKGKLEKSGYKDGLTEYSFINTIRFKTAGIYKVQLKITTLKKGVLTVSEPLTVQCMLPKINMHLLTVGTEPPNLDYTMKDARDMKTLFNNQMLYKNTHITPLLGESATADNIRTFIQNIKNDYAYGRITSRDMVVLFFSGHGYVSKEKKFYFQADDFNRAFPEETGISLEYILTMLKDVKCKKMLMIDACHSGTQNPNTFMTRDDARARALQKLLSPQDGWTIITSSGTELSWEHDDWQNGTFTEAFVEGMNGAADTNENGLISIDEIYNYLKIRTIELNEEVGYPAQYPKMFNTLDATLEIFGY